MDESHWTILLICECWRRFAGAVERCTCSIDPTNGEVAVRLGRWHRLSAPRAALHSSWTTPPRRSAVAWRENAESARWSNACGVSAPRHSPRWLRAASPDRLADRCQALSIL